MLTEMSVEVIRKCPNNCIYCSSSSSDDCAELIPLDVFKNIVDGAIKLHLETLCFSGGEPFLHPNFIEMIEYVKNHGIRIFVYTSGIYLDNNKQCSIPASIMVKIKGMVSKLIFNVESCSDDTYDRIMGTTGCFTYLKESIRLAVSMGITCEAHFIPMTLNIGELDGVVKFCEEMGISKLSFLRLVSHGRASGNKYIFLNDHELELVKKKLIVLKDSGHSLRIGVPLSEDNSKNRCEAATGKLNIKYDGTVHPCEVFKNINIPLTSGSLPESIFNKELDDIYLNSSYLNDLRTHILDFCKSDGCENCAGQMYLRLINKCQDDHYVK